MEDIMMGRMYEHIDDPELRDDEPMTTMKIDEFLADYVCWYEYLSFLLSNLFFEMWWINEYPKFKEYLEADLTTML